MPQNLPLKEFLAQTGNALDVRSPSEYHQGHIPESISLPLFNDAERAQIGTVYKKQGKPEAVELGLLLVQSRWEALQQQASVHLSSSGKILCWRGGMRSGFTARLLELLGYSMSTLQGGYKAYRRWALKRLETVASSEQKPLLLILGGMTGSGKTTLLQSLKQSGEQVIDLEALANHRGSAFGGIGLHSQPTQEQFENDLAFQLEQLDWTKPVWLEDESRLIGRCHLPHSIYQTMRQAPLFLLQCPHTERIENLMSHYGKADTGQLLEATARIAKRLGSKLTKDIRQLIAKNERVLAFEKLLTYYDKSYQHQLSQRRVVHTLKYTCPNERTHALQDYARAMTQNVLFAP